MPRCIGVVAAICVLACLAMPAATISHAQEEWGDEREGKVRIPDRIGELWLSADMLVSRNGGLLLAQHELLDQSWGEELSAALESPGEECLEIGPGTYAEVPLPTSFSDAVEKADAIIYGAVTGIAGGFYAGMHPGLLIQVEVKEWVDRQPDYPERPYTYFYYPVGDFRLGSIEICKKDTSWPDPPKVGDEVLLFPRSEPLDPDGIMARITMDGVEVVTGNQAGVRISTTLFEIEEFRAAISVQGLKRLMAEMRRESQGVGR